MRGVVLGERGEGDVLAGFFFRTGVYVNLLSHLDIITSLTFPFLRDYDYENRERKRSSVELETRNRRLPSSDENPPKPTHLLHLPQAYPLFLSPHVQAHKRRNTSAPTEVSIEFYQNERGTGGRRGGGRGARRARSLGLWGGAGTLLDRTILGRCWRGGRRASRGRPIRSRRGRRWGTETGPFSSASWSWSRDDLWTRCRSPSPWTIETDPEVRLPLGRLLTRTR